MNLIKIMNSKLISTNVNHSNLNSSFSAFVGPRTVLQKFPTH